MKLLESVENAGALDPTGSEKAPIFICLLIYLNDGTGKPCAGHKRLKLRPLTLLKIEPLEAVANVGAFEPTGSRIF